MTEDFDGPISFASIDGDISFKDFDALSTWLRGEESAWQFFRPIRTANSRAVQTQYQGVHNELRALRNKAATVNDDPNRRSQAHQQLVTTLNKYYSIGRVIASNSPRGEFTLRLAESDPELAAAVLAYFIGVLNANDATSPAGATHGVLFEQGLHDSAAEAYRNAFDAITKAARTELDESRSNFAAHKETLAQHEGALAKLTTESQHRLDAILEKHIAAHDEALESTREELAALKKTYDEELSLKAPAEYWRRKRKSHRNQAWIWAGGFAGALILATGSLVALFWPYLFAETRTKPELPTIAALIALAVPGLWLLRVVARNLLSNLHLATDAHERETMVVTYLALMRGGAAEPADRGTLLTSIFRPTATGIVVDDAMPSGWWDLFKPRT